jgi:hypothetical protein
MLNQSVSFDTLLKRIDQMGLELERLKRDLLISLPADRQGVAAKPSLFGSVPGGDITDAMITEAQQRLFRPLNGV